MKRNRWYSETLEALGKRPMKLTMVGAVATVTIAGAGIVTGWMFQNPVPGWYEVAFMASTYGTGLGAMYVLGLQAADRALGRESNQTSWLDIPQPLPGSSMSDEEYCKPTRRQRK